MRFQIVSTLADRPSNMNKLAKELGVDYKAIQHHIKVLLENQIIQTPIKNSYGAIYFLTNNMEQDLNYVKEIWKKYGKT